MNKKILLITLLALVLGAFLLFQEKNKHPSEEILLYGNVDVRQVDISFRVPGKVEALFAEEGDLVEPGIVLAQLDEQPYTDQLAEAKARIESAEANFTNAEKVLKRRNELITDGSISQEDLDNTEASKRVYFAALQEAQAAYAIALNNLAYTQVQAPTAGTILTRIREPGTVVNAADPIFTLSIFSPVWIRTYCTEPQLGLIYPGMIAEIFTDTPGGKVYRGQVGFISPMAEFTPKTVETSQLRTDLVYRLRIYVENPDGGLRQGMPVTVRLDLRNKAEKSAAEIPTEAFGRITQ